MNQVKPTKLIKKTYLAALENSVGAQVFRHFYVTDGKKEFDALEDGRLACAAFVSGILTMYDLIEKIHGTVQSTVADLEKSGWTKIEKPVPGSVLVWEEIVEDGEGHKHIGFYLGNDQAISNSSEKRSPQTHHWLFDGERKVEEIYWNPNIL